MTKIIKTKDIVSLSNSELEDKVAFYKRALFDLRFSLPAGDKKDKSLFSKYKKNVAKIKTVINQRMKEGQ